MTINRDAQGMAITTYMRWLKSADQSLVAQLYEDCVNEVLAGAVESDTHFFIGSQRLNSTKSAKLEADLAFAGVSFASSQFSDWPQPDLSGL